MNTLKHAQFNQAFSDQLFGRYMNRLENRLGNFPFRVAETPLILSAELRDRLARHAQEIVAQLSEPQRLAELKKAIPAKYDVPGMDALPNCVQVDFALTRDGRGNVDGKVVELQAFPSLYALMTYMADAWAETMNEVPSLKSKWGCFINMSRDQAFALMRETLLAGNDPQHVVLVDVEPEHQKTSPDFEATRQLFGVDPVCVTKLIKRGRQLFRVKDGKELQVKRIYNRMVFDELEVKGVKVPFNWNDDLDVSWVPHPNWYWVWSKFSLPHLSHGAIPAARYLSQLQEIPEDLSGYVLKPLFSFAGAGVKVDVTRADIDAIPPEQRSGWVLQEKIEYAPVISMPDGNGVKAEVRVMLLRAPHQQELTPLLCLVRLSRGKMIGVDFNKNMTWVGGSVGIWEEP